MRQQIIGTAEDITDGGKQTRNYANSSVNIEISQEREARLKDLSLRFVAP